MLDTCSCSFIMREHPVAVLERLQGLVEQQCEVVISAITDAEMQYGSVGRKASPKHAQLVAEFIRRLDSILPWDRGAVDAAVEIKRFLSARGTPIGANDNAIPGHAIASGCILVTNHTREFARVPGLTLEDGVYS